MDSLLAATLAAVGAVLITLMVVYVRRLRGDRLRALAEPAHQVEDYRAVVSALTFPAVLIGPHDEVIAANQPARDEVLVSGTRIVMPEFLDLARRGRSRGTVAVAQAGQPRAGRTARRWVGRAVPLTGGYLMLLVEDEAPMLLVEAAARDFLANATHELKTPVGAIALLAEAIGEAPEEEEIVRRFAERLQHETARLNQLVAQVVQLSQLLGSGAVRREAVAVDDLLAQGIGRHQEVAAGRRVTLTTAGETGLTVLGDTDQLLTALSNLIENAIRYSDADARVVLSARAEWDQGEHRIAVAVSDTGIGIPAAEVDRIFERFYRVDYARSRDQGGSGLGLAIVQEILHAHGGTVAVWSKPGSGSTFTLTLPAAETAQTLSEVAE
ncbi:MAG: sensor histidine kinase [Propioniciclava sp.]